MGTMGAPQTAKAAGGLTDWWNCWRGRNVFMMCSVRRRPWATKYNVEVGLALGGCSLRWPAGVSSNLDYSTSLKPSLLHFLAPNLLYFCLFHSRCSKETHAMFWGIQGTAGTANFWSTKPLQTLDQSRYCPFAWRKIHSWKHSTSFWTNISGFLFCFVLFFSQTLKRSKGPISSLSLLQHCSSNRNRNCWRPEKSDLKRFRGGNTYWLSQEGFCYCGPKYNCGRCFAVLIKTSFK